MSLFLNCKKKKKKSEGKNKIKKKKKKNGIFSVLEAASFDWKKQTVKANGLGVSSGTRVIVPVRPALHC